MVSIVQGYGQRESKGRKGTSLWIQECAKMWETRLEQIIRVNTLRWELAWSLLNEQKSQCAFGVVS